MPLIRGYCLNVPYICMIWRIYYEWGYSGLGSAQKKECDIDTGRKGASMVHHCAEGRNEGSHAHDDERSGHEIRRKYGKKGVPCRHCGLRPQAGSDDDCRVQASGCRDHQGGDGAGASL